MRASGLLGKNTLALCLAGFVLATTARAAEHVIEIRDFVFLPAELEVSVGDTVTWINYDVAPHTATAETGDWDSSQLDEGMEWSITFDESAQYSYLCTFHPAMTGVVTVVE